MRKTIFESQEYKVNFVPYALSTFDFQRCSKQTFAECHLMACSTCSSHGLNGRIYANFPRDITLKNSRSKLCWISYTRTTELHHCSHSTTAIGVSSPTPVL